MYSFRKVTQKTIAILKHQGGHLTPMGGFLPHPTLFIYRPVSHSPPIYLLLMTFPCYLFLYFLLFFFMFVLLSCAYLYEIKTFNSIQFISQV